MGNKLIEYGSLFPIEHHASFFKLCFAAIGKYPDSAQFTQWMLQTGTRLMPHLAAHLPPEMGNEALFFRALAKQIWEATPLPHKNFHTETLPLSAPQNPDSAGSTSEECSATHPHFAQYIPQINMLPFVLSSMPKPKWVSLMNSGISISTLQKHASHMLHEHRAQHVVALLAPWFPFTPRTPPTWPPSHAPLLQLLLKAYQALGLHQLEERIANIATQHAERAIRGVAWLQLAILLSEQVRLGEAWDALHYAEALVPDHPDLAQIEVKLLIHQENWDQASRRGHFWALRLHRLHGETLAPTIETLNQMAANPKTVFTHIDHSQQLAKLITLAQHAPAPECVYHFVPQSATNGTLEPEPQLQEALDEWYQKYTFLPQQAALEGVPYDLAWEMAPDWMPLLNSHPILWHSFEVLDDLSRMIAHGHPQQAKARNLPLITRSAALFDTIVQRLKGSHIHMDWNIIENRPAMHLAIQHLNNLIDRSKPEPIVQWLEKMLFSFHRSDEQHWREILMPFYLSAGRFKKAIDLASRYPDNSIHMQYDHALALFMDGQQGSANDVLTQALALYPMIAVTLQTRHTQNPRENRTTRKIDAADEPDLASAYFDTHIGIWSSMALAWLNSRFPLSLLSLALE
jgi:tetratricopeptide (TPR) repeat protein